MRIRELGITIGSGTPGVFNAITDVPGVRVGHHTLNVETGDVSIHSGVTVIEPRAGATHLQPCFAGVHVLSAGQKVTVYRDKYAKSPQKSVSNQPQTQVDKARNAPEYGASQPAVAAEAGK